MGGKLAIVACAVLCLSACAKPALAINIVIDDTYDTNGFFAARSQARAALDAAADYYSAILDDTFSQIVTPDPFTSSLPPEYTPGTVQWEWTMNFTHPSAYFDVTITNPTVAVDEYRLYVGAKFLDDPTLGQGGPGGSSRRRFRDGGFFTPEEIEEINAIHAQFTTEYSHRGEENGFARWGGLLPSTSIPCGISITRLRRRPLRTTSSRWLCMKSATHWGWEAPMSGWLASQAPAMMRTFSAKQPSRNMEPSFR